MDISALESRLKSLEASWSSLDSWLNFWTALVVVGVVMEIAIVLTEYQKELHEYRRGTISSPGKPNIAKFALELLGAGLVAIGVAGEFAIHTRAGKIESDMRDATRQLVALVEGDAAKANERASANEKEAERLRLDNSKIVAALRQPMLTRDEQKKLSDDLKPCARVVPNVPILIEAGNTNSLAVPVLNAMKRGGFTKAELRLTSEVWFGVFIRGPSNVATTTACISSALVKKMTLLGTMGIADPPGSPITISIGERPIGELPKVTP